jgi:biotin carboxyl carrier protein
MGDRLREEIRLRYSVELELEFGGERHKLGLKRTEDGYAVTLGERTHRIEATSISPHTLSLKIDEAIRLVHVASADRVTYVAVDGRQFVLEEALPSARRRGARDLPADRGELVAIAPMPGKVVKIHVSDGDRVERGNTLAVVEAMKMENEVRSTIDGYVDRVLVKEDDMVNVGQPLVELRTEGRASKK